eukprot:GHVS01058322.1.p1 GENE.GHVS01058322.1~~GHVS01058322.1.p1  ORF type:complete len:151 (+),score=29.17 GHVS01058322.1:162-614(+)
MNILLSLYICTCAFLFVCYMHTFIYAHMCSCWWWWWCRGGGGATYKHGLYVCMLFLACAIFWCPLFLYIYTCAYVCTACARLRLSVCAYLHMLYVCTLLSLSLSHFVCTTCALPLSFCTTTYSGEVVCSRAIHSPAALFASSSSSSTPLA